MLTEIVALGSAIYKGIQGARQNRLANKIHPQQVDYAVSPYAKNNLGLAQQLYGGRMAGASQMQNNIYGNQANTLANVGRNATSSSQALAMAGSVQGQTNQALNNLQLQEAQSQQQRAGLLMNANEGMTAEQDKVYQDKLRKYREDVAAKAALRQSGQANIYSAIGDLGTMAASVDNSVKQVASIATGGMMPMGATNTPQLAQMPMQAPNTGMIPLPSSGSIQNLHWNSLTNRWE